MCKPCEDHGEKQTNNKKQDGFLHIITTPSNCQKGKCLILGGHKLGHLKRRLHRDRENDLVFEG